MDAVSSFFNSSFSSLLTYFLDFLSTSLLLFFAHNFSCPIFLSSRTCPFSLFLLSFPLSFFYRFLLLFPSPAFSSLFLHFSPSHTPPPFLYFKLSLFFPTTFSLPRRHELLFAPLSLYPLPFVHAALLFPFTLFPSLITVCCCPIFLHFRTLRGRPLYPSSMQIIASRLFPSASLNFFTLQSCLLHSSRASFFHLFSPLSSWSKGQLRAMERGKVEDEIGGGEGPGRWRFRQEKVEYNCERVVEGRAQTYAIRG